MRHVSRGGLALALVCGCASSTRVHAPVVARGADAMVGFSSVPVALVFLTALAYVDGATDVTLEDGHAAPSRRDTIGLPQR